jgi:uncharacterized damage-inducible protein DinB
MLQRGYDGDCWHGPNLRAVLAGVHMQDAIRTFPPLTHSIWGIVNHLAAWIEVVIRRIDERRAIEEPATGDFPPVTEESDTSWATALAQLDKQHRALLELIENLHAARLDEIVAGKNYPIAEMLCGTAEHYAYHAGQIALLKKLAGVHS